jgi:hypothetical protein
MLGALCSSGCSTVPSMYMLSAGALSITDRGKSSACRRADEATQAAMAIGHATIRILALDSVVVQCDFGPLECVNALIDFVKTRIVKPEHRDSFALFVSPPKREISAKTGAQTFWDAGMVPGAHCHPSSHVA